MKTKVGKSKVYMKDFLMNETNMFHDHARLYEIYKNSNETEQEEIVKIVGKFAYFPLNFHVTCLGFVKFHMLTITNESYSSVFWNTFDDRELKMIKMRYEHGNTLDDIGRALGISKSRVLQILAKAERRMRHPSRLEMLYSSSYGLSDHLMMKLERIGIHNLRNLISALESKDLKIYGLLSSDDIEELKHIPILLEVMTLTISTIEQKLRQFNNAYIGYKPSEMRDEDMDKIVKILENPDDKHSQSKSIILNLVNKYGSDLVNEVFSFLEITVKKARKFETIAKTKELDEIISHYTDVYYEYIELGLRYKLLEVIYCDRQDKTKILEISSALNKDIEWMKDEILQFYFKCGKCTTIINNPELRLEFAQYYKFGNGIVKLFIDTYFQYYSSKLEYNSMVSSVAKRDSIESMDQSIEQFQNAINEMRVDMKEVIIKINNRSNQVLN